jgi:hypothetical protein
MLRLCRKDWIAGRWAWLGFVVVFELYVSQPGMMGFLFPLMGAGLVLGSLFVTFALDDRGGAEALYGSLPLRRSTVVGGRYLLAGLLAAAGGAIVFGSLPLLDALTRARHELPATTFLLSPEGVVGFLLAVAPPMLIFLPLCFGYGFGRGTIRFVVVMGILGFLAAAAAGPRLSRTLSGNPVQEAVRALGTVRGALGTPLFIAAAVLVTAGLTAISLALSMKAYERREL